jgi:hypothetical protein
MLTATVRGRLACQLRRKITAALVSSSDGKPILFSVAIRSSTTLTWKIAAEQREQQRPRNPEAENSHDFQP